MMALIELLTFVWKHPLNAGHRLAALTRVVRWQTASRLLAGPFALPFVENTFLLAARGMTGATGNWYCGLHELPDMGFVLHLLRPEDRFLDIGANVGSYTILAAGVVGAPSTSVEPIPATFSKLLRNVAFNNLASKVTAWQGGLSDAPGVLTFTDGLDTTNHVVTKTHAAGVVDVPVRTVDDLIGPNVPTLIKIDVEGHERAVLRGATQTLTHPALLAVVMEINGSGARYDVDDEQLIALMRAHGFEPYAYDPFARRLIDPSHADDNTIFVRDVAAVETRLRTARKYRLVNGEI